jgi:predicted permease
VGATVAKQVLVLFILILVGLVCRKRDLLTRAGVDSISRFIIDVSLPCMAVTSLQRAFTPEIMQDIILVMMISLCVHTASFFVGRLLTRKMEPARGKVYHFAILFSNSGFLGIPVIQAAIGDGAVIYPIAFMIGVTIITWTFGISIFTGKEGIKVRNIIKNPGVIGMLIGIGLFALQIRLPDIPLQALTMIGDITSPVSMIVVGANLAGIKLKDLNDRSVYTQAFFRLVLLPMLLYFILQPANVDHEVLMSTVLLTGMPVAAITTVFAGQYGADAAYASKLIFVTTFLSIPSIPLLAMLF